MSKVSEVDQALGEIFDEQDQANEQRLEYIAKLEEENLRMKVTLQKLLGLIKQNLGEL